MIDYGELVAELREYWNDGTEDLRNQAADAIEELQAAVSGYEMNTDMAFVKEDGRTVIRFIPKVQCPHYRPNHHDRGDDSLCDRFVCEVKALPRWIPVTERLPEDHDWVLVWHTGYKTPKKALFHIEECFEFDGGGAWYDYDVEIDGHNSLEGTVTHWMPLPDPPEEVEA